MKFFSHILYIVGEYENNMGFIDVSNNFEKINFIEKTNDWMDYRELRNELTHDYPEKDDEIRNGLIKAVEY